MLKILLIAGALVALAAPSWGADCTTALKTIFAHEGGYQCIRSDSGNWTGGKVGKGQLKGTKFGIAANSYPNVDIKNLTIEKAATYYERDYWNPLRLSECKSQGLATTFLDTAVNAGEGTSALVLIKTVNYLNGKGLDFPVRPIVTPAIMVWVNTYTKDRNNRVLFYLVYQSIRSERYAAMAKADKNKRRFLADWLIRTWSY